MIGTTVSRYRILEKLGEGGMGEVYLARDTELNRNVALKFLPAQYASDAEVLARFRREAQTAAALNHPNIITVHEVGQHGDRPFISMAYVEGQVLSDVIAAGALPVEKALDIALQVCDGLGSAHHAGVVHRDVKPGNIILDREGRVKILDFGLARPEGVSKLTGEISTFGTIYYMSPEQVRGDEVDARSDLFSLGAVFYEMFTGRLPFRGDHTAAVIYSITNEDPKPPSHLSPKLPQGLDAVILKLLSKEPAERYHSASEVALDLRRVAAGGRPSHPRPRRKLLRYALPTSVVFALVILALLLKPLRVEIGTDHEAIAAQNTVAIMYFDNLADPADPKRLGEIVANLLITDLSESDYMQVVTSQQLFDILKLQGLEEERVLDRTVAADVATQAGAKWMLTGSILQEEPSYIVTSRLVEVGSGRVAASQRITGEPGESIFSLVDRLTSEIKKDMALPAAAGRERDAPVAEVTTHSTEAYRYYLEGVDFLNKVYGLEAKAAFDKALEHDSTFAMVYLKKGSPVITGSRAERKDLLAKAVQYSKGVSKKERHYIMCQNALLEGDHAGALRELESIIAEYPNEKEAYRTLGDVYWRQIRNVEKAIPYYRKVIEIDPADKTAYNTLAYIYQERGDIDNYIWAIYQYMSLAPNEANPYDSRGDLYAYSGKTDKAIKSYQEALEKKPDFYPSRVKLGHMYVFERRYGEAMAEYAKLVEATDPMVRSESRMAPALVSLHQGKVDEASKSLQQAIEADRSDGYEEHGLVAMRWALATLEGVKGKKDEAIRQMQDVVAAYRRLDGEEPVAAVTFGLVRLYSEKGDFDKAEYLLDGIKTTIEQTDKSMMPVYWWGKGVIAFERGDAASACVSFEKAVSAEKNFHHRYYLGLACLKAGRHEEAAKEFEEMLRRFSEDRATDPLHSVMAHYKLGLAYEQLGRTDKAIEQYTVFLDTWKNADPYFEEIADARRRVDALRAAAM